MTVEVHQLRDKRVRDFYYSTGIKRDMLDNFTAWRKYRPIELTALKLLEYIRNAEEPISINRLMRIKGMGWQRRDRIRSILRRFEELGLVEAARPNPVGYRTTEHGIRVFDRYGKNAMVFLEVFRGDDKRRITGSPEIAMEI